MPKKKVNRKESSHEKLLEPCKPNYSKKESTENLTVDCENKKKYEKRKLVNNWKKYETALSDLESTDSGDELPKTNDFEFLLSNASSDNSRFQFKSEKLWSAQENPFSKNELFNLDLGLLCSGLACVPFYERIGLDPSELSESERIRCDEEAKNNLEIYNPIRQKFLEKLMSPKSSACVESQNSNKEEKFFLNKNISDEASKLTDSPDNRNNNVNKKDKELLSTPNNKTVFSENEDLENWLDSVLDE